MYIIELFVPAQADIDGSIMRNADDSFSRVGISVAITSRTPFRKAHIAFLRAKTETFFGSEYIAEIELRDSCDAKNITLRRGARRRRVSEDTNVGSMVAGGSHCYSCQRLTTDRQHFR